MIASTLLNPMTLWLGWIIYAPLILLAIMRVSWIELVSDFRKQHLLFGTVFALCVLWLIRRDFPSGVSFHFIGMTSVALLLGWPLALLAGLFAQTMLVLFKFQDIAVIGINGLLLVVFPIVITECAARYIERLKPENLFVYIFGCGFFPAALAAIGCICLATGILWVDGIYEFPPWLSEYFGVVFLVAFPEAFINGMVISSLVVFKPEWLETFNRTRYLQAPWKHNQD